MWKEKTGDDVNVEIKERVKNMVYFHCLPRLFKGTQRLFFFWKLTVRRSKYCLENSKARARERLQISG